MVPGPGQVQLPNEPNHSQQRKRTAATVGTAVGGSLLMGVMGGMVAFLTAVVVILLIIVAVIFSVIAAFLEICTGGIGH